MSKTKVIINAHFPTLKPAHNAFISKQGEGGTWDVAVCDAVRKIKRDDRLKGKQAKHILPAKLTVAVIEETSEVSADG